MLKIDPLEPLLIAGFHQLGCNVSWIARLVNCSRNRVYRQLRALDKFPAAEKRERSREARLSKKRKKEIVDLESAGISPIDIALVMEIALPVVLQVVYETTEIKRRCLRCDVLNPDWICKKCRRRRKKERPGLYDDYASIL
ncbi:MAG: hypothetical protein ACE5FZ_09630 [Nitrospiria bacterium]